MVVVARVKVDLSMVPELLDPIYRRHYPQRDCTPSRDGVNCLPCYNNSVVTPYGVLRIPYKHCSVTTPYILRRELQYELRLHVLRGNQNTQRGQSLQCIYQYSKAPRIWKGSCGIENNDAVTYIQNYGRTVTLFDTNSNI